MAYIKAVNEEMDFELKRIALTWEQIQQYNPPPNPTKLKDVRSTRYVQKYGMECWELDALEPTVIGQLIKDAVADYRDDDKFDAKVEEQENARAVLRSVAVNWNKVAEFLSDEPEPNVTGPVITKVEEEHVEVDFTVDFGVVGDELYDDTHRELASGKMHLALHKALKGLGFRSHDDADWTETNVYIAEEGELGVFYVTIYRKVDDLETKLLDYLAEKSFDNTTITGIPEEW
jgi:hypothetical protein